ncbi:FecR family protein [Halalkalibaculum sp. DA384]|uniref:FecR family protein n=1 Tax=Halalkalibaculum sp. DA384 TaxID=3373606 RepID=UPI003754BB94
MNSNLFKMYPEEVIRYISGDYSEADEQFVRQWLEEDPSRKAVLRQLREVWEISGTLKIGDVDRAWADLSQHTTERKKKVSGRIGYMPKKTYHSTINTLMKVAAVLLVLAGAYGFYVYSVSMNAGNQARQEQVTYRTVSSQAGERLNLRLRDGTKIVLNESSTLHYADDYEEKSRNIHLEGEAYFEVNHDHPHPFVVYANNARVEDIGTKFNVKTNGGEEKTEVVVSQGKVKVSPRKSEGSNGQMPLDGGEEPPSDDSSVIVSEGQKVDVTAQAEKLTVEKADLNVALAWLENQLIFDAEPLSSVIRKIEDHYQVHIEVADSALYRKKLTAAFEKSQSLENVIKVLSISLDAQYSIEDQRVRLYREQ